MQLIEPRNLKGFRDYLPQEQIARARMLQKIRGVFELYGFEPLDTPALEYEDVLAGKYGAEGEQLMYRFEDHGGRKVAMRYDLTVPLARVTAQYQNDLPRPFKRYQVAPVWRADNTQRGRYREFTQCDADAVGAEVGIADAECIAMAYQILRELGINNFTIKVNNRKILNAIMLAAGVPDDKILDGIRSIDKLEKIGAKAVAEELQAGLGLQANEAEGLIRMASTKVPDIGALESFINEHVLKVPQGREGFDELSLVFTALRELGITENIEIDLSLARGLDYYTATIIEAVITETPEARAFGSVAGGGRYDRLVNLFIGKDIPAVGISIGIDRLFAAMETLGLVQRQSIVRVLVLNLEPQFQQDYLKLVTALRQAGISAEMYYATADKKKQFSYAESKAIPYAIFYGTDEAAGGYLTLRDLRSREDQQVSEAELIEKLQRPLAI